MQTNKKVIPIKYDETIPWLLKKHYAHRIPAISYSYGLYIDNILAGIVTYGSPPSYTLTELCGKDHKGKVIELNRLVLNENLPKNSASYLVGNSLKLLPKPKIVVSFADTAQGHIGYIYQATNWIYTGISPKRTYYKLKTENNENTPYRRRARMSKKEITNQYGENYIETYFSTDKHRYLYFLDCKELIKELKYPILPYPKGETKRYHQSEENILTQMLLF